MKTVRFVPYLLLKLLAATLKGIALAMIFLGGICMLLPLPLARPTQHA